jgi:hypothetical protein
MYARIVIDLLKKMHFVEHAWQYSTIRPKYIPISCISFCLNCPLKVLCHLCNNRILGIYVTLYSPHTLIMMRFRSIRLFSNLATYGERFDALVANVGDSNYYYSYSDKRSVSTFSSFIYNLQNKLLF